MRRRDLIKNRQSLLILRNEMADMIIRQMPPFKRVYKKLRAREKLIVNDAIHAIIKNPKTGQEKKGDLAGVFVHKFKIHHQEMLLAYEWSSSRRLLLALGTHENFYRKLKKQNKTNTR